MMTFIALVLLGAWAWQMNQTKKWKDECVELRKQVAPLKKRPLNDLEFKK